MENIIGICPLCGGYLICDDEITDHVYCDTCEYETEYGERLDT